MTKELVDALTILGCTGMIPAFGGGVALSFSDTRYGRIVSSIILGIGALMVIAAPVLGVIYNLP